MYMRLSFYLALFINVHSTEKNAMMQICSQINDMKAGDHDSHANGKGVLVQAYSSCQEQSLSLALRDGRSLHKTHN